MLFLEMPIVPGGAVPGGDTSATHLMLNMFRPTSTTAPEPGKANGAGLRQLFAAAVGLDDPEAVDLLLSGRTAVAADGWSGLSDAVLVAWPSDPAALEQELASRRTAGDAAAKLRRYGLARGHELACDGKTVLVGRMGKRTSLFARTLDLLDNGNKPTLADQAEFRDRTATLPADSQAVVYVGKATAGTGAGPDPLTAWWPEEWPRLRTIAMGLKLDSQGLTVRLSGRLDMEGPQLAHTEPPVQVMRRLPSSVVAVWTQALDYVGGYRHLRSRFSSDADGFHFDSLEAGMEPDAIEKRILGHLVGDTVVVVDQVTVKPDDAADDAERLTLPAAGLMVETDDPDAVAGAVAQVAGNLVALVNKQLPPEQAISLQTEAPGGATLYVVSMGRVLGGKTRCDWLTSLQLTVGIVDRWLVVATHPLTARRLIDARRGQGAVLPVDDLDRITESVAARGGQPRRMMVAQPRFAAEMIDSWIDHVGRHHQELLQPQWWVKVLRHQRATGKQLGILARSSKGTVEVVDTLPGGPARDRLQPGDRIMAVDGTKVDPAEPLKSLREYIADRPQASESKLLIQRGDKQQEIVLPLPADEVAEGLGSPIEMLKRFAAVSRFFGSAGYVMWQPKPDVVDARIDLRFVAATQPASQPTSQPASRPVSRPASQPATRASTQPATAAR
jgi:hypothetical protein